ncbi:MAG TPA: hypothetical protein VHP31_01735 [Caproicibacter sp.]|nr:hypothetical protein [Caproicibacter sp.]
MDQSFLSLLLVIMCIFLAIFLLLAFVVLEKVNRLLDIKLAQIEKTAGERDETEKDDTDIKHPK